MTNKYKNLGIGAKAIEAAATYLEASVTDEDQIDAAIAAVETLLKAFQSEADTIRTAKTEAEKRAAELDKKIKALADGDNRDGVTEGKDGKGKVPAWAQELIDGNKKLSDELAAIKDQKVVTDRKGRLNAIIEKLPEALRKPYQRMDVKNLSDEDFDALTGEVSTEVETLVKESAAQGAVFGRPKGGTGVVKKDESSVPQDQLDEIMSGLVPAQKSTTT